MEKESFESNFSEGRESRFGDEEELIKAMSEGEVVEMGSIDELFPDISPHQNEVDIIDIDRPNLNQLLGVKIQKADQLIRCVFKPFDGENQDAKNFFISPDFKFYPRECAAYLISRHFDLDIVPPTVIREINGRIGALQLFLDHDYFETYKNAFLTDQQIDQVHCSLDWQKIAILDWLILNWERHGSNMMIRKISASDPDPNIEIAAIDHGMILCSANYVDLQVRGPVRYLTMHLQDTQEHKKGEIKKVPIPQILLKKIKKGLGSWQDLAQKLISLKDLTEEEIDKIYDRANFLLTAKVFLSKINFVSVFPHLSDWAYLVKYKMPKEEE